MESVRIHTIRFVIAFFWSLVTVASDEHSQRGESIRAFAALRNGFDAPIVDDPARGVPMTYYPINDFGPAMKGMVIGGLGIFHVFLAQFAIGGGMLMSYFQWLAMRRPPEEARVFRGFLDSYFRGLVLISFVLGALTGVGMWFTSIQVSPRTIGLMVEQFHWLWATEWTFFCLEVVAGYAFYRYGARVNDSVRMRLLLLYTLAAWFSLFWINGILSWQLTPGWNSGRQSLTLPASNIWPYFFNPGFFPSLLFRTVVCMTIAALAGCVVVNAIPSLSRDQRATLMRPMAHYLAAMAVMPILGLWYFATLPADSRQWVMGGSVAMTLFMTIAVGASVLIGGYAIVGLLLQKLYINGATATLLLALAFSATAGGEFVREGVRKPYTIRQALYSNSMTPPEVEHLRLVGVTTHDPFPMRDAQVYPTAQLRTGAQVYRNLCSVCHTLDGANGITHLAGSWTLDMKRQNLAKLQRLKTFMPPFAGTALELEALVQFIDWHDSGRPATWSESNDPAVIQRNQHWLDEAGTSSVIKD